MTSWLELGNVYCGQTESSIQPCNNLLQLANQAWTGNPGNPGNLAYWANARWADALD